MSGKLPVKSGMEVMKTLSRVGFILVRVSKHYIVGKGGKIIPVPYHKEVKKGTLRGIIKQADLTIEEFLKHDP
ncbi:MAG: type II toxin-antitoxin system HicA family toxin [Methanobacteriota archaeon]